MRDKENNKNKIFCVFISRILHNNKAKTEPKKSVFTIDNLMHPNNFFSERICNSQNRILEKEFVPPFSFNNQVVCNSTLNSDSAYNRNAKAILRGYIGYIIICGFIFFIEMRRCKTTAYIGVNRSDF